MQMSPLNLNLLLALRKGPLTGYDLSKSMKGSYVWNASHQQIYRDLTRLHKKGLLSLKLVEQEGKPDKKVYALTPAGRIAMREASQEMEANLNKTHSLHTVMIASENVAYFEEMAVLLDAEIQDIHQQIKDLEQGKNSNQIELLSMHRAIYLHSAELKFCRDVLDTLSPNAQQDAA